jgi:hypothetical protein
MQLEPIENGKRSLRLFFEETVWRHFFEDVQLEEPAVANYVANLLVDFAHSDSLYRIRNGAGRPLEEVAEMMIESNSLEEGGSFDRERAVRKHVGDYTLFMTGLFPESVARIPQSQTPRLDSLIEFVHAGKESYAIVSSFDQFDYREQAPLFRRLSEHFEACVAGLNLVKQDIRELRLDP